MNISSIIILTDYNFDEATILFKKHEQEQKEDNPKQLSTPILTLMKLYSSSRNKSTNKKKIIQTVFYKNNYLDQLYLLS